MVLLCAGEQEGVREAGGLHRGAVLAHIRGRGRGHGGHQGGLSPPL